MEEFKQSLISPAWWLGVVVVGLLVNLASAYLKPPIDGLFSKISTAWSDRSRRSRAAKAAYLAVLTFDPEERQALWQNEIRYRFSALLYVLVATFGMVFAAYLRQRFVNLPLSQVPTITYWMITLLYGSSTGLIACGGIEAQRAAIARAMLRTARFQAVAAQRTSNQS